MPWSMTTVSVRNSVSPTVATSTNTNSAMARGATATARPIASPSPTGDPRHRASAATIVASVVTPVRIATNDWRISDATWPSVVEPPSRRTVSTDGDRTPEMKPPMPAGSARARNNDHSRPRVSNVRPTTSPRSAAGRCRRPGRAGSSPARAAGAARATARRARAAARRARTRAGCSGVSAPSGAASSRSTAEQYARRGSSAPAAAGIPATAVGADHAGAGVSAGRPAE